MTTPPPPPDGFDPISEETLAPIAAGMGARLTEWRDGYARLDIEISATVINRQGLVHGGAIMTFLDGVAGYSGLWCPYPGRMRNAVTLSLTANFVSAASSGALIAEGRRTGGGRSVFFTESAVRAANGALIATATGVFKFRTGSAELYGIPRPGPDN